MASVTSRTGQHHDQSWLLLQSPHWKLPLSSSASYRWNRQRSATCHRHLTPQSKGFMPSGMEYGASSGRIRLTRWRHCQKETQVQNDSIINNQRSFPKRFLSLSPNPLKIILQRSGKIWKKPQNPDPPWAAHGAMANAAAGRFRKPWSLGSAFQVKSAMKRSLSWENT